MAESGLLTDLLDMDFSSPLPQDEKKEEDLLADTFAKLGVSLATEPVENKPEELVVDLESVELKVKRILDAIPDYGYLFEE